jgi:Flp pilus assembly protein TadG
MARRRARHHDDGGSAVVEVVVLAPVFFLFIAAIVLVGKLNVGSAHVEVAARSAARSISLAADPAGPQAAAEAERTARDMVKEGEAMCRSMSFDVEVDLAEVTVTIGCDVDLREASLLAVPGTRTVTASATEVIDRYRETG